MPDVVPDYIWPVLASYQDCLCEAFDYGLEGGPERCCIYHSTTPTWDECQCGLVYVRLNRMRPATSTAACKGDPWVELEADIEFGVLRCAPVVDSDGTPPSCAEISSAALAATDDLATLIRTVLCCMPTAGDGRPARIYSARPSETQGGCMGSLVEATVTVFVCLDCEQSP